MKPFVNFGELLSGLEFIAIGTNHSANKIFLLSACPPLDYLTHRSGASFPKINPDQPQTYVVFSLDQFGHASFEILDQPWNFHFVQPLPNNEFLLVCARSGFRGANDYDLNGCVFGTDGSLKRSFLLGDGIQDVQTTSEGKIWTSFFDEGVGGNYGWKHPIGSSGLIQWDLEGRKLFEYAPSYPLDMMADCYALNVTSERDVWCYYYTEFPLVHLQSHKIVANWEPTLSGSDGFAVWKDHVLFRGGYGNHHQYFLYRLGKHGKLELRGKYELKNENGENLISTGHVSRGHLFLLAQEQKIYQLDLRDIM